MVQACLLVDAFGDELRDKTHLFLEQADHSEARARVHRIIKKLVQKLKVYACDVTLNRRTFTADRSRVAFFRSADSALANIPRDHRAAFVYPKDFSGAPSLPLEDGEFEVRWWYFDERAGPGRRLVAKDRFEIRDGHLAASTPDIEVPLPTDDLLATPIAEGNALTNRCCSVETEDGLAALRRDIEQWKTATRSILDERLGDAVSYFEVDKPGVPPARNGMPFEAIGVLNDLTTRVARLSELWIRVRDE